MINRSKESFELIIDIGIFFLHDFDFVCGFIFLDLLQLFIKQSDFWDITYKFYSINFQINLSRIITDHFSIFLVVLLVFYVVFHDIDSICLGFFDSADQLLGTDELSFLLFDLIKAKARQQIKSYTDFIFIVFLVIGIVLIKLFLNVLKYVFKLLLWLIFFHAQNILHPSNQP